MLLVKIIFSMSLLQMPHSICAEKINKIPQLRCKYPRGWFKVGHEFVVNFDVKNCNVTRPYKLSLNKEICSEFKVDVDYIKKLKPLKPDPPPRMKTLQVNYRDQNNHNLIKIPISESDKKNNHPLQRICKKIVKKIKNDKTKSK